MERFAPAVAVAEFSTVKWKQFALRFAGLGIIFGGRVLGTCSTKPLSALDCSSAVSDTIDVRI